MASPIANYKHGKKVDKGLFLERLNTVMDLQENGFTNREIAQNAAKKWNLSERQIHEYIRYANKRREKLFPDEERKERTKARAAALYKLYKQQVSDGKINTALNIMKEINKMEGAYQVIEHHGDTYNQTNVQINGDINILQKELMEKDKEILQGLCKGAPLIEAKPVKGKAKPKKKGNEKKGNEKKGK